MSNEENISFNKVDNNDGDSSNLPPVPVPSADLGPEDRAILDALKGLELKRKFDVKTLSSKVSKRVLYLKDIQVQHDELEEKFHEEKAALEAKYDNLFGPLFAKRYEIVNGLVEVEEKVDEAEKEEVKLKKGVPNFWLIAMKTNELIANEITEQDEKALKYLKDIKCCRAEDKTRNFKLEFLFDTNPYLKNSVLSKTYHLIDEDGPALEKVIGTNIEWCPGKCLTHKVVKKEPKKGSKKPNIPMTKIENCESFFNFFKPPEVPDIDELDDYDDFDTNMTEELTNLMDQDYEIAVTIRDKLIPHAVSWFTGEALVDDEELDEKDQE